MGASTRARRNFSEAQAPLPPRWSHKTETCHEYVVIKCSLECLAVARTIVLFSEENALGNFVSRVLRDAGYSVRWEMAADAALEVGEQTDATVLVADARSDEVMPDLVSGWRSRVRPEGRVVMITRAGGSRHAGLADEVVSSPLAPKALRAAVEKVAQEAGGG